MNGDIIVGIFSAVFCAAYVVAAWLLPDAAIGNPMAPKYFPLMVGLLALAFSLALIVRGAKKGLRREEGQSARSRPLGIDRRAHRLLSRLRGDP